MKRSKSHLWERVAQRAAGESQEPVFVPVDDPSIFFSLAGEIARIASKFPGKGLTLIVDSCTADTIRTVDAVRALAEHSIVVQGTPPDSAGTVRPKNGAATTNASANSSVLDTDRFLLVYSSTLSMALFGTTPSVSGGHEDSCRGGWSSRRSTIDSVKQALAVELHQDIPPIPDAETEATETSFSHATQLMAHHANQLTSLERNAERAKHDLFSVLEILKAISSRRRSHDVLFVFVEQIARIVEMERCSVVRVWGGEPNGHVLASHDDSSVDDLVIALKKYPELLHAMRTFEKVAIKEATTDPITREQADELGKANVHSILVIPIVLNDPNIGSLLLRAVRGRKPFTMREVSFCEIVAEAASNALERAHLFESIQRANERLEHLAVTDGLTGIYNHRYFRERLEQEFERARRYKLPLSCLIFDIDNFKHINDTHGHLQGDVILREMAGRTLKATRKADIVARYGGEEFTVIMPQTGLDGAKAEAERLLVALREPPYKNATGMLDVTVSIGVAVLDHDTMLDCEALIRTADGALYDAKRNGKNQVVVGGDAK